MHRPHAKDLVSRLRPAGLRKQAPKDIQRVISELRSVAGGQPKKPASRRGRR